MRNLWRMLKSSRVVVLVISLLLIVNLHHQPFLLILCSLRCIYSGKSKHGGVYKRRNVGVTSNSLDIDPPMKMARTLSPPSGMRNGMPSVSEMLGGYGMASEGMTFSRDCASREITERICDHISDIDIPTVGKDVAASEKKFSDEFSEQKPEDSVHALSSRSPGI